MANISAMTSAFKSALLSGLGITKTKNEGDKIVFTDVTAASVLYIPHSNPMQSAGSTTATYTMSFDENGDQISADRKRIERLESIIKVLLEHATPEARMAVEVLCEQ